jgi:hypothetical protein
VIFLDSLQSTRAISRQFAFSLHPPRPAQSEPVGGVRARQWGAAPCGLRGMPCGGVARLLQGEIGGAP